MANTIKIKSGSGTPTTSDIVDKELAFDRGANKLYINDNGSIVDLTGSGATGDIEGVTAGNGLTGGGTSGTVTLNIGAGTGIDVAADAISVDVSDFMSNGVNNRILTATGADAMNAEANLTWNGSDYFNITSADGAEGGIKLLKSSTDATHTAYHISHRDDNQSLIIYSYDGTTFRNWITLDEPNALLKLGSNSSALSQFDSNGDFFPFRHIDMGDSDNIKLGDSDDLRIRHDGSNSIIQAEGTGDLVIRQDTADKDILLRCDDGSGGIATYITIDGSDKDVDISVPTNIDGAVTITEGSATNTVVNLNGSAATFLEKDTGTEFYIANNVQDQDIKLRINDGGSQKTALWVDASDNGSIKLPQDGQNLYLGASNDFRILHDGSNNYINSNTSDQDLYIRVNDGGTMLTAIRVDSSDNARVKLPNDNQRLAIGASDDIQITHDGSNSYIDNYTGNLNIKNNEADKDLILLCDDGSGGETAYLTLDGSQARTYANKTIRTPDSVTFEVGNAGDGAFFHNGSNTFITNSTGHFYIDQYQDDGDIIFRNDNGSGGNTNYMVIDGGATAIDLLQDTRLKAAKKLYFDGGGNSYVFEESADNVMFYIGGRNMLRLHEGNGEVVVNDSQVDTNFRVEGDSDSNLLFTDAGNDRVGIGESSPISKLHVQHATDISMAATGAGQMSVEGNGYTFGVALNGSGAFLYHNSSSRFLSLGTNETEQCRLTTGGAWHVVDDVVAFSSTPSDKKLKTNVKDIEYGLDTVMKLKPKHYDWKKDNRKDIGFIAQEVEEVIPEIVKDNEWFDDKVKTLDYEKLTAVLIKAVQEQQEQINELKEKLNG